jgi:hypothetical protein
MTGCKVIAEFEKRMTEVPRNLHSSHCVTVLQRRRQPTRSRRRVISPDENAVKISDTPRDERGERGQLRNEGRRAARRRYRHQIARQRHHLEATSPGRIPMMTTAISIVN